MAENDELRLRLNAELDRHLRTFSNETVNNQRFAFWHDVGLTALSALATALIGLTEIYRHAPWERAVRALVLLFTAGITVFAACGQFFKFKSQAEAYGTAATRLLNLRRALSLGALDSHEDLERAVKEFEGAVRSVAPVWEDSSVWTRRKPLVAPEPLRAN